MCSDLLFPVYDFCYVFKLRMCDGTCLFSFEFPLVQLVPSLKVHLIFCVFFMIMLPVLSFKSCLGLWFYYVNFLGLSM